MHRMMSRRRRATSRCASCSGRPARSACRRRFAAFLQAREIDAGELDIADVPPRRRAVLLPAQGRAAHAHDVRLCARPAQADDRSAHRRRRSTCSCAPTPAERRRATADAVTTHASRVTSGTATSVSVTSGTACRRAGSDPVAATSAAVSQPRKIARPRAARSPPHDPIDYAKARELMVEQQVRPWDVLDPRVLDVLADAAARGLRAGRAPRAGLRRPRAAAGPRRGDDEAGGRRPHAAGAGARAGDEVLEIGTGSGFLTACLGRLAREVVSIERHADLADAARARAGRAAASATSASNRRRLRLDTERRFDAICVTGAVDAIPPRFVEWLRPGGRMFVVHGRSPAMEAVLVRNDVNGAAHRIVVRNRPSLSCRRRARCPHIRCSDSSSDGQGLRMSRRPLVLALALRSPVGPAAGQRLRRRPDADLRTGAQQRSAVVRRRIRPPGAPRKARCRRAPRCCRRSTAARRSPARGPTAAATAAPAADGVHHRRQRIDTTAAATASASNQIGLRPRQLSPACASQRALSAAGRLRARIGRRRADHPHVGGLLQRAGRDRDAGRGRSRRRPR